MTFEDAADAYVMIQSGLSIRKAARVMGVSHTRLGQVIASCREHGKASPELTFQRGGTPHYPQILMSKVARLRMEGVSWKEIGKALGEDPEKLARAFRHWDKPKP